MTIYFHPFLCSWLDVYCLFALQVVRYNYTAEERRALLELIGYIKSIGLMMQHCDTLVSEALWETIHMEVQDFVQDKLDTMLRTTFRKKKDLSR
jgi:cytoplasmic FMR1 interacting protein